MSEHPEAMSEHPETMSEHPEAVSEQSAGIRFCWRDLLFSLCLLGASGCLVQMPLEQEETPDNQAPRYQLEQLIPSPERIISYDPELSDGAPLDFFIGGLDDPNAGDALFWRVFLNYQGLYYHPIHRSNRGVGLSAALRMEGIRFQVDPCLDFRVFESEGPHRVELIVSDRPFIQESEEEGSVAARPNQALPSEAESFTIRWFISFSRDRCPF